MSDYCPYGCEMRGWFADPHGEMLQCPAHSQSYMREPAEQRALKYHDYLVSPEWYKKRAHFVVRADNRCQICDSARNLQVHHLSYAHVGEELPEDVMVVCRTCHMKAHDLLKEQAGSAS